MWPDPFQPMGFSSHPLPGEKIKIGNGAKNKSLLGKTGTVIGFTNITVEVDGKKYNTITKVVEFDNGSPTL